VRGRQPHRPHDHRRGNTKTCDLTNWITASGTDTYSYDATDHKTGEASNGATTAYTYDVLGPLIRVSGPATTSYTINGDGLHVSKTVRGETSRSTWDASGPRYTTGG